MTALEEYEKRRFDFWNDERVGFSGRHAKDWLVTDAAIAELQENAQHWAESSKKFHDMWKEAEAARDHTIVVLNDCQAEMGRQCARADEAEAAFERLADVAEPQAKELARVRAKLAAVEEERDRLKLQLCQTCGHVQHYTFDGEPRMCCRHPDSPYLECDVTADFACNQWTARLTGKEEKK